RGRRRSGGRYQGPRLARAPPVFVVFIRREAPMSESDQALVRKAQRGDRAAFEELVRRTSRLVFARLYLETGDTHRAEDLVQETLLKAFRTLGGLSDPTDFRPWLLKIAQNVVVDAARHDSRQKRA